MADALDPAAFLGRIRDAVDGHLRSFLEAEKATASRHATEPVELIEAIADLTLRGGKRFRPAMLAAGFLCVDPRGDIARCLDACAALELLQSYLLIHDDWMDDDAMRRGGPSVHALLRRNHGQKQLGDSLAILAGDLACAQAWALLFRAPFPADRAREGYLTFVRMQQEVVLGQHLDLIHSKNVAAVHRLKTGSYTVPGPLRLGALLADGSEAQIESLVAYGEPLGEAFQIRDDLLGTFGDPKVTGKGIASDLREGKHTALIAEAERSLPERELIPLRAVLGRREASEEELLSARSVLDGEVREKVEASANALVTAALESLRGAPLQDRGVDLLRSFAERIAVRDR